MGIFQVFYFLYINNKRYIFSFGYDIEFETIKLMNCNNPVYNSYEETYSNEEIADVYTENYYLLKNEMKLQIGI